jgi:hypothetical protein
MRLHAANGSRTKEVAMVGRRLAVAALSVITIALHSTALVRAQGPTVEDVRKLSTLVDIRQSVIRTTGAPAETVDISVTGKVLTVARINSNMNRSTHAGRDNEAKAIAAVVSERITGQPEFSSLVAIRVQYEMRSTILGKAHILVVDAVDFRASPEGRFQFHQT